MAIVTKLSITPPAPFDFEFSAYSHGWVVVAPNSWDEEFHKLQRVERLSSGKVVFLEINSSGSVTKPKISIDVNHTGKLSVKAQSEIKAAVALMFRFEEDFSEFYTMCEKRGKPWNRMTAGLGRMLRSPTVFEDVIKTICTTNIQWGGTKRMVEGLVDVLGQSYPADRNLRAFPTPKAMAEAVLETFTDTVRLGYRGDYIYTLAQRVASGELDLEALRDEAIPTPELKKELLAIKGVGNYAAATLLMLLGRYDELAVDTVFRTFVSNKYFAGERPSDDEAKEIYTPWGKWKYLAYWFDLWQGLDEEL
ncbi:MAG: DNA-3-methyladenine glycosylase 2 family protein [Chloroflexi bacterium]|nr:DNA-3-methyladenine glycosylase 2 family protein [Chloroflexota bacterium]